MRQEVPDLHSVILIRGGKMLVNANFYPYDGATPHDVASVTKSVTTTLLGIAIDRGKLSLDDSVLSFFPDRAIANRNEWKDQMTVEDLATTSSGLACLREPGEPTQAEMSASGDWVQFVLDLPMAAEPGSQWNYCSPGFHLLSAVLTEATGQTALDFAWDNLFGPLGIRDVIWPADPQGYTRGMGDLMLRPSDAAKLGQLWLNGGVWEGRQIVSQSWVEAAATVKTQATDEGQDYGYGWWIERESEVGGEYRADGRGGQYVLVVPALDVVLATTGSGSFDLGKVGDRIAQALVDPTTAIPANPAGVAKLTEVVSSLVAPPVVQPVPPLPEMAEAISGKTFRFAPNPLTIETLRLDFSSSDQAGLEIGIVDDPTAIVAAVGLDGVYHFLPGDYGFPIGARGTWEDEQTFVIDLNTFANDDAYDVRLRFVGNAVTLELTDRTRGTKLTIEGMSAAQ
jgi:CubicO group peptidase (beta-lactamase class C family)